MKPFPCIESTLDITNKSGSKTVRLWVNRIDIPLFGPDTLLELVERIKEKIEEPLGHEELLKWLTIFPCVNAAQLIVVDDNDSRVKYGTVVYTVPFEDVHG